MESDLVKQLEDKKKGCGRNFCILPTTYVYCEKETYCPICKAEIAILEQAIAEMQKQRQEILDRIDKCCDDDWYKKEDIYGGDYDYNEVIDKAKEHIKQQLNQPKDNDN